jgi:hypothetical protein
MQRAETDRQSVEPPPGVSPGVLGTIVLGRAGYEQVTATMLKPELERSWACQLRRTVFIN